MSITGKPIVGVAVFFDGICWKLPKPNRHHDVIRLIKTINGIGINGPDIQGFYDSEFNFLNRRDAYRRALQTGQLKRDPDPKKYQGQDLYSEDLW